LLGTRLTKLARRIAEAPEHPDAQDGSARGVQEAAIQLSATKQAALGVEHLALPPGQDVVGQVGAHAARPGLGVGKGHGRIKGVAGAQALSRGRDALG
jgi:hypothetical protein